MIFVLNHYPIGADVDLSRLGIFRDDATAGAQVRSAVEIMPTRRGKFVQIDVVVGHLVFEHRPAFDLRNRHGFVGRQFLAPGIKIVNAVVFLDAPGGPGAFTGAKDIGDDAKAGGIIFEMAEEQRRSFFFRGALGQGANFGFQLDSLKSAQLAHLFQYLDVSPHVGDVGHEFPPRWRLYYGGESGESNDEISYVSRAMRSPSRSVKFVDSSLRREAKIRNKKSQDDVGYHRRAESAVGFFAAAALIFDTLRRRQSVKPTGQGVARADIIVCMNIRRAIELVV